MVTAHGGLRDTLQGGVEAGVPGVLCPENGWSDDDRVVRDIQKPTNRLHGAHRVAHQSLIRDHREPRIPFVLAHDLMGEPPGERHLKNGAGGFLLQGRSDDIAWVPAHYENPRVLWKPFEKRGRLIQMPGCLLHPPGIRARLREFTPALHQGEQTRLRPPCLFKRACEDALDFISRDGWPVLVKRRP